MKPLWGALAGLASAGLLAIWALAVHAPFDARLATLLIAFAGLAAGEASLSREGERGLDALRVRLGAAIPAQLGGALLLVLELAAIAGDQRGPWIGAALMALGIGLRLAAIRQLGTAFVSGPEVASGQRLEQRGVYRIARHPSELGLVLLALGTAIFASSPAVAIAALLLIGSAVWRARREDRLLAASFGTEFEAYRRRVGGFGLRLPRRAS